MNHNNFFFYLAAFTPPGSEAVLPEEITKELEALSLVDDARKSRIERLEKLRRREDVLPGEDDDDDEFKGDQSLHESAESSVEGKSCFKCFKQKLEIVFLNIEIY
jgi:hypothetical protein